MELTISDCITLDFLIYCGKGMFTDDDPFLEMPRTGQIPSILIEQLFRKGHVIFSDSYFTSPSLTMFSLQNHTHLSETVRTNRNLFSKKIVNVPLHRGTAVFYKLSNGEPIMSCKISFLRG